VRRSNQILWLAFFAVLATGVVTAPSRLASQQAPRAAASQPASQPQAGANDQAKPEAAKQEAVGENKFRLTPTVHAAARIVHLSDETMARIFEFINFAIIALAILIPLVRFLPKVFRKRSETLRHSIESARKVTEDANARLSAVEAKLSSLGDEIAKFRAEVEQESLHDETRIKLSLEEESTRIVAAAEQEIDVAAAQARRTLRHFATDLAIQQAAKQLVLTPETDRALIAEFVGDVARNGSAKGGQN
jgi:F-type H+-transporting ATPase subunit b